MLICNLTTVVRTVFDSGTYYFLWKETKFVHIDKSTARGSAHTRPRTQQTPWHPLQTGVIGYNQAKHCRNDSKDVLIYRSEQKRRSNPVTSITIGELAFITAVQ